MSISTLQTRAQQLIDRGLQPVPARGMATLTKTDDPKHRFTADECAHPRATDLQIRLGPQLDGYHLCMDDLDSHKAGQDASARRAELFALYPALAARLAWVPTQRGWHVFYKRGGAPVTGRIYDQDGRHIGERLGRASDRVLDPGDLDIPILTRTEVELLTNFWRTHDDPNGVGHWTQRAKEGKRLACGYQHIRVKTAQLRAFLLNECGKVGTRLAGKLDTATHGERSDLSAHLMQCLMLHAHKLAGWDTPAHEKYRMVMAYWMTAESFGKADDRDYNQEKDGYSLLAQIVNEDPFGDGRRWTCPFWAKSTYTHSAPAEPESEPEPRSRGRPAGSSDKPKRLARLRKALEAIEPDEWGRRVYLTDVLSERLKIKRRTLQDDFKTLRDAGEITTGQIGRNGKPYAVLLEPFGATESHRRCANKSPKADKPTAPAVENGGANETLIARIPMPETPDPIDNALRKEDHQDLAHPTGQPSVASPLAPAGAGRAAGTQHPGDPLPLAVTADRITPLRPLTTRERCELAGQHHARRRADEPAILQAMAYAQDVLSGRIPPPEHLKPWRSEYSMADRRLDEAISIERWEAQAQPPPGRVTQDAIRFPRCDWPANIWEWE